MNRRKFIYNGTYLSFGLPIVLQGVNLKAYSEDGLNVAENLPILNGEKKIVIIQLSGGNDGLNTVIPLDQYSKYFNVRPNIAIEESRILPLTGYSGTGLHPALSGLHNLFKEGMLSIIQSVGVPNPSMSHFRDTDIWHTASHRFEILKDGWIGRFLSEEYPGYPSQYPNYRMPDPLAIEFGVSSSLSLLSDTTPMGYSIKNPTDVVNDNPKGNQVLPDTEFGNLVTYLRSVSKKANSYSASVKLAFEKGRNFVTYPKYSIQGNQLAEHLQLIARLIHGGLQTRVFLIRITGYDTHFNQVAGSDNTGGQHGELLSELSGSIKAFQDDLNLSKMADNVIGVTVSEFGRRIKGNSSKGTDHGAAAPLFVFGSKVIPGLFGTNPLIPENPSVWDTVPYQFDFRSIYQSLLKNWLCQSESASLKVLLRKFDDISIVKNDSCSEISNDANFNFSKLNDSQDELVSFTVYPNPVYNNIFIRSEIEYHGQVEISLIDVYTKVIRNISAMNIVKGQSFQLNISDLKAGIYKLIIKKGGEVETMTIGVKL